MYTLGVSADRRYQLQSEPANRAIDALLEQLRIPESSWRHYADMLTTVLKMFEDGSGVVDLKITSAALKELRYGSRCSRRGAACPRSPCSGRRARPPSIPSPCRPTRSDGA